MQVIPVAYLATTSLIHVAPPGGNGHVQPGRRPIDRDGTLLSEDGSVADTTEYLRSHLSLEAPSILRALGLVVLRAELRDHLIDQEIEHSQIGKACWADHEVVDPKCDI